MASTSGSTPSRNLEGPPIARDSHGSPAVGPPAPPDPAPTRDTHPGRTFAARVLRGLSLPLLCLGISAALVYPPISKYQLFDPGLGGREGDVGQYVKIHQGVPLEQVARPYRYRVFTPILARLVPPVPQALLGYFDVNPEKLVQLRFGLANLLGLALTGVLLAALCRALGFAALEALLATLLFYTSFVVINFGGTAMVDAWGYAFLTLGLVAALRGSRGGLAVASLLGMLAKETTLLLVPAVLLLRAPARTKAWNLAALLPGILAYAVFRFVLVPGGYSHPGDPETAMENLLWRFAHGPYLAWLAFDGGTAFGILWLFAAIGLGALRGRSASPLARLAWLVPGILLMPFAIGSNIGRIWFFAFPVMIPLAVIGLRRAMGLEPRASAAGA